MGVVWHCSKCGEYQGPGNVEGGVCAECAHPGREIEDLRAKLADAEARADENEAAAKRWEWARDNMDALVVDRRSDGAPVYWISGSPDLNSYDTPEEAIDAHLSAEGEPE